MEYAVYALYAIVAGLAIYAATRSGPKVEAPTFDPGQQPTADEGTLFKVLYGTKWDTAPLMVWYGDPLVETETQDHRKTYKYYLGMHAISMQGTADKFLSAKADDRVYWSGDVTENETILVSAGSLFGGKKQRGGIVGYIDVLFGLESQAVNEYLEGLFGVPFPALRGSSGLVFNQAYLTANNPYIAPHAFRWRRIYNGWRDEVDPGDACWYPETAGILDYANGPTNELYQAIMSEGPAVFLRFEELAGAADHGGEVCVNTANGADGRYLDHAFGAAGFVPDGTRSAQIEWPLDYLATEIIFDANNVWNYHGRKLTFIFCITLNGNGRTQSNHYLWHEGDHAVADNQGLGAYITIDQLNGTDDTLTLIYFDAGTGTFKSAHLTFSTPFIENEKHVFAFVVSEAGFSLLDTCDAVPCGTATFPTAVPPTSVPMGIRFCGASVFATVAHRLAGRVDNIVVYPRDGIALGVILSLFCPEFEPEDINPVHAAYDLITNQHRGMGRPFADINDDDFRSAALACYVEAFGVSFWLSQQESTAEVLRAIEEVVDCVFDIDPLDGRWYAKLIRDDYDADTLPEFDDASIIKVEEFASHGYGNLVTRVKLKYSDPSTDKPATVYWDNPATYGAQSQRMTTVELDFPQIRNTELAKRVVAREGRKRTHPLRAFTVVANRDAYGRRRGDAIKVSSTKLGLSGVICRVVAINYGSLSNREITLGVVEDVFGLPQSAYVEQASSQWEELDFSVEPITAQTAMELPRWHVKQVIGGANTNALDDAAGYAMPMGLRPAGTATGYDIWRQLNAGGYSEELANRDFVRSALLNGSITGEDTAVAIDASSLDVAVVGDLLQIGTGATAEIVRLTGGDLATTLQFTRGHLDTTPQAWSDDTRIWRLPEDGQFEDDDEYTDGDVVDYKLLTNSPTEQIEIGSASAVSITLGSRAVRPIAPGNVTINSEAWPTLVDGDLTVAWAHRNRVNHSDTTLQSASGITSEAGVTYNAYAYNDDTDALLDSDAGLSGTSWAPSITTSCTLRIELEAERDGFVSWQRQVRAFQYITTDAILTESAEPLNTESGETIATET